MLSQAKKVVTNPDEQVVLLEEGNLDSHEVFIPLCQKQLTTLIQDYNKFLGFSRNVVRGAKATVLLSSSVFAVSTSFFALDTDKVGLLILGIFSGVIATFSLTTIQISHSNPHHWMFAPHLPSDYDIKKRESLNIIKEHGVSIKDEPNAFEILSALKRVENIIKKGQGTPLERKKAIRDSLALTMFKPINSGTKDPICEEIFEYADLAMPKNRGL